MPKYEVIIWWSDEDACFFAEVPDLPGCKTHGDTYAEAATNVEEAISLWLDVAQELGRTIPRPRKHAEAA